MTKNQSAIPTEEPTMTIEKYAGVMTARLAKLVNKVTDVLEKKDKELSQNGYDLQNKFRQGFMLAESLVKKVIDEKEIKPIAPTDTASIAWKAWDEDQKINPSDVNPYSFVYGYEMALQRTDTGKLWQYRDALLKSQLNNDFDVMAKYGEVLESGHTVSCNHDNSVWANHGHTLYCRDCKSTIDDRTGISLSECKEIIAKLYEAINWNDLIYSTIMSNNAKDELVLQMQGYHDQAAELFAQQSKPQDQQTEKTLQNIISDIDFGYNAEMIKGKILNGSYR